MTGRVAPVLLLLNVLLLAAIASVWLFGALSWAAPDPVPVDASLLSVDADEGQPPPPDYDRENVLGRPLFAADRRPMPADAVAEVDPVAPPADALSSARLLGLVGEGAAASVIIQSEGKTTRLPVGGEFGTWKLEAVDRLGADFVSAGGESRRVVIQRSAGNPAASAANTANAAAQAAPGTPQARAAERRARREALLRQAQERSQ